jgi:hypothetical protein
MTVRLLTDKMHFGLCFLVQGGDAHAHVARCTRNPNAKPNYFAPQREHNLELFEQLRTEDVFNALVVFVTKRFESLKKDPQVARLAAADRSEQARKYLDELLRKCPLKNWGASEILSMVAALPD